MRNETAPNPSRKRRIVAILIAVGILVALAAVFFVYTGVYYHADGSVWEAAGAYAVTIQQKDGYIAITPVVGTPTAGYVFYPGGKVEAQAYLPYLAQVAEEGYYCALLQVPFRLAVLDMDAAARPIADNPDISVWAVGGHSLGGVAAADFAGKNGAEVQGLVLLASYSNGDISGARLEVASVTATEDSVLAREKYEQAQKNLPLSAEQVSIAGGNHSQFGMYGRQEGDGAATILPQEQQTQVAAATTNLLERLR